jgi:hypothetical protein
MGEVHVQCDHKFLSCLRRTIRPYTRDRSSEASVPRQAPSEPSQVQHPSGLPSFDTTSGEGVWELVGRRRGVKAVSAAHLRRDDPSRPLSTSLASFECVLSRPLEEVARDVLVRDIRSVLDPWAAPDLRAVLLGVGSPTSSATSRHQLALALLLVAELPLKGKLLRNLARSLFTPHLQDGSLCTIQSSTRQT